MRIAIIDLETTGFLKAGGKIVEVGIAELDLETGEVTKRFHSVCHEKGITRQECEDSWIVKNSTLTVEDIRTSPSFNKIKPEITRIIGEYWQGATAYNNVFDFGFLESRGVNIPKKLICPMKALTDVLCIPGKYGKNKWPSAQEAFDHYFPDEEYIEKHRAYDDAEMEARIVYKAYITGDIKFN